MFKINITKLPKKHEHRSPENLKNKKICIKQYTIVEMNPNQSNNNSDNINYNYINEHKYSINTKL